MVSAFYDKVISYWFFCFVILPTAPKTAPNFIVEETSSDSILVKWEDIPIEECRGFLKGYLLSFAKGEKDALKPRLSESGMLTV